MSVIVTIVTLFICTKNKLLKTEKVFETEQDIGNRHVIQNRTSYSKQINLFKTEQGIGNSEVI